MAPTSLRILLFFLLFVFAFSCHKALAAGDAPGKATILLSGSVFDTHKEPVKDAEVKAFLNGSPTKVLAEHKETDSVRTTRQGTYQFAVQVPADQAEQSTIRLDVAKTSFSKKVIEFSPADYARKGDQFYASRDAQMSRVTGPAFWIATMVFLIIYALISFELLHRTVAAVLGAAIMLMITYTLGTLNPEYHIISFERAVQVIDMNVIFLLMAMMIIVGVLKQSGVFEWCAYASFKLARGNVFVLAAISSAFIATTSAFLDNVTTMLLYTPVLIQISAALRISPLILLIPGVMASNVGGTATLIGDPPNIMIGSYAGLTFMQFVYNLTIPCIIGTVALILYSKFYYGRDYARAKVENLDVFIAKLRDDYRIKDRTLLTFGLIVVAIAVGFFLSHGYWHMEVSIPALLGAAVLFTYAILTKKVNMLHLIEKDIEWTTLLFFMFLFIIVGSIEETGLLAIIADGVFNISQGNLLVAICMILWVSAIASAFVDNIPFTATMLPIVAYLTKVIPGAETNVLWWALALGACLGGNGTMIGASANVVTMGIAESAGYPIRFFDFMKYAFPYMLLSVIIANIWLLLFY